MFVKAGLGAGRRDHRFDEVVIIVHDALDFGPENTHPGNFFANSPPYGLFLLEFERDLLS